MRVLMVGGSGTVGSLILDALSGQHEVTVADVRPPLGYDGAFVQVDVLDHESLSTACRNQEALVYLAMGPKGHWGEPSWAAAQFDINVKGLYLTLNAAAAQGVRRAVYASTGSIFDPYRGRAHTDEPDAWDAYGLSKRLGELICRAAVREHGLEAIALRLIGPMPDKEWAVYDGDHAEIVTAGSDVAAAFVAALSAPLYEFSAVFVCGDHDEVHIDLGPSRKLLGWQPMSRRSPRVEPRQTPRPNHPNSRSESDDEQARHV